MKWQLWTLSRETDKFFKEHCNYLRGATLMIYDKKWEKFWSYLDNLQNYFKQTDNRFPNYGIDIGNPNNISIYKRNQLLFNGNLTFDDALAKVYVNYILDQDSPCKSLVHNLHQGITRTGNTTFVERT